MTAEPEFDVPFGGSAPTCDNLWDHCDPVPAPAAANPFSGGAPNPFEKTQTLPPIAVDHDHEMKDGQLFHTHGKGGAHRHV